MFLDKDSTPLKVEAFDLNLYYSIIRGIKQGLNKKTFSSVISIAVRTALAQGG